MSVGVSSGSVSRGQCAKFVALILFDYYEHRAYFAESPSLNMAESGMCNRDCMH